MLNGMHAQPITPVDERVSPDEFLDERLIKIGFVGHEQLGNASLRDYTAVICLVVHESNVTIRAVRFLTCMISSSLFSCAGRT